MTLMRRKFDRVLIVLFFIDLLISMVLVLYISKAIQVEKDTQYIVCVSHEEILNHHINICDEVLRDER